MTLDGQYYNKDLMLAFMSASVAMSILLFHNLDTNQFKEKKTCFNTVFQPSTTTVHKISGENVSFLELYQSFLVLYGTRMHEL